MALPSKESFVYKDEGIKKAPVVEIAISPEVPEVEQSEYIKEINKEVRLKEPVRDGAGLIVMNNPSPKKVKIVLSLTEQEMNKALHLKVIYSIRWLAEVIKRLMKIASGTVEYHYRMQEQGT